MGELSDRLDPMAVEVVAPDGQLTATLSGWEQVKFHLSDGAYERYDDRGLADQLTSVLTALWVEHLRRAEEVTGEGSLPEERMAECLRVARKLLADGRSPDGKIYLRTQGLTRWWGGVRDGTVRSVPEDRFLEHAALAHRELMQPYRRRLIRIYHHFDRPLPAGWSGDLPR